MNLPYDNIPTDMQNETLKTIFSLKSTRKFSTKSIPRKNIDIILDAAIHASNSGNRQVYSIIVVDDPTLLKKYFYGSNKTLVFLIDYNRWLDLAEALGASIEDSFEGMVDFTMSSMDAMLAAQNAALAAKSLGIDTLFTSSLHRETLDTVYHLFNLPTKYCFPYLSLALGYALDTDTYPKGRVKTGVIHWGTYHHMTAEELTAQIAQYDEDSNRLGFRSKTEWQKDGFAHYLNYYFSRFTKASLTPVVKAFYRALNNTKLLETDTFLFPSGSS